MKKSYIKPEVATIKLMMNTLLMLSTHNQVGTGSALTNEEVDFDDDENFWGE